MKFKAQITILPRPETASYESQELGRALESIEVKLSAPLRSGKYIELILEAESEEQAHEFTNKACEALLYNKVSETFSYQLQSISEEEE